MADSPWSNASLDYFTGEVSAPKRIAEQAPVRLVGYLDVQAHEYRQWYGRPDARFERYQPESQRTCSPYEPATDGLPPRPPAIDLACAANPEGDPLEVVVEFLGREVHRLITPGSDPAAVWRSMYETVINYYAEAAR